MERCLRNLYLTGVALAFFVQVMAQGEGEVHAKIVTIPRSALHEDIRSRIPEWCDTFESCNDLVRVDCRGSLDAIERYFSKSTGELVMNCGGRCMNPQPDDPLDCKECPPAQWQSCK